MAELFAGRLTASTAGDRTDLSPFGANVGMVFSLVTFLTPRILRSALRAGFAVRAAPAAQWRDKGK
jgi:hypothetical protein